MKREALRSNAFGKCWATQCSDLQAVHSCWESQPFVCSTFKMYAPEDCQFPTWNLRSLEVAPPSYQKVTNWITEKSITLLRPLREARCPHTGETDRQIQRISTDMSTGATGGEPEPLSSWLEAPRGWRSQLKTLGGPSHRGPTLVSFNTWSSNQVLTVNAGGKKPPCFTRGERRGSYLETHLVSQQGLFSRVN